MSSILAGLAGSFPVTRNRKTFNGIHLQRREKKTNDLLALIDLLQSVVASCSKELSSSYPTPSNSKSLSSKYWSPSEPY
jgi:hypothetical protein